MVKFGPKSTLRLILQWYKIYNHARQREQYQKGPTCSKLFANLLRQQRIDGTNLAQFNVSPFFLFPFLFLFLPSLRFHYICNRARCLGWVPASCKFSCCLFSSIFRVLKTIGHTARAIRMTFTCGCAGRVTPKYSVNIFSRRGWTFSLSL